MKKILILFVLFPFLVFSQDQKKFDSLKALLPQMKEDTNKAKLILAIGREGLNVHADSLFRWAEIGLEFSRKIKSKKFEAGFLAQLGVYYLDHSEQESAVKYNLEALKIYEELHDLKNIARMNMNLGNTFYYKKDYKESIRYLNVAIKLYDSLHVERGIADCSMNLANNYFAIHDTLTALDLYEKSLKIREKINDKKGIAQCLSNLADTYSDMGDYEKAMEFFNKAVEIKKELGDNYSLASSYLAMAKLSERKKQYDDAIKFVLLSISMCDLSMNPGVKKEACLIAANLYAQRHDYKSAYQYELIGTQLKDSIFSEESNNSIAEMQTKYETDKKQKENELLKQKNQIQKLESGKKDAEIGNQRIIIICAIVGLVLMLLLAVFIFKGYQAKRKAHYIISLQKKEVERQKDLVDEKQKSIVDSITYAKRIQGTLLASESLLKKNLPEYFVLYKPKDIVSGDFYWAAATPDKKFLLLTGDCTGHGVPGAFMSLLNITFLNEIVTEHRITQPDDILNEARKDILLAFNQDGAHETSRDGMDCSLVNFDFEAMKMSCASAYNPVVIIRDKKIIELPPDKQPVGFFDGDPTPFTLHKFDLQKNDIVYTFTDGYFDQFGGEKGKKFKYSQLCNLLLLNSELPLLEQKEILEKTFVEWKGNLEQVDDVLVIGVKIC